MFVASAGAYAADSVEPMHVEGDKRKASAGRLFGGGGGGRLEMYVAGGKGKASTAGSIWGAARDSPLPSLSLPPSPALPPPPP